MARLAELVFCLAVLTAAIVFVGSQTSNCVPSCPTAAHEYCSRNVCICDIGYRRNNVTGTCELTSEEYELHPQDGWYNNLLHPNWGGVDGQLLRPSPPAYSDGVFEPSGADRPNPLTVSQTAFDGLSGLQSHYGRNAMLTFFGQQVVEEIMDSQRPGCPREFFNVPIPDGHPYRAKAPEMPLLRTRYDFTTGYSPSNPRQQLNEITPYIDGTLMYGIAKAWTDTLRSFEGGRLKQNDQNMPITNSVPVINDIRLPFANPPVARTGQLRPVSRFYRLGNPRGFENPFLLTFGILWFRYHNVIASRIQNVHPDWNDEQIFNAARKRVIAQHQKIVMYDWLPIWLQLNSDTSTFPIPKYSGYKPHVHPGITQEFQSAALRFGHTLVPAGVFTRRIEGGRCELTNLSIATDGSRGHQGVRLCQAFWSSQEPLALDNGKGFEDALLGMAWTRSEQEDHIIVADLRHNLFGPLDFTRRDLGALNIQRARDHGLPGYNTIREVYGLDPVENFTQINTYPNYTDILGPIFANLSTLYGSNRPDNLDVFVGGLLETTDTGPGPLFRAITLDAFTRIRDGDRFWFENTKNGLFSADEVTDIMNTDLGDIIALVSNISRAELPENVFLAIDRPGAICRSSPPFSERNATERALFEVCGELTLYDYFSGSEVSFALTFVGLGLFVLITIGVMICMGKMKERQMNALRARKATSRAAIDPNKFEATEWVGPKSGDRNVRVELVRDRKKIIVNDLTGRTLRLIDLRQNQGKVHIRVADDSNQDLLSIRVQNETDLVLRFVDINERMTCLDNVEKFLQDLGINRDRHELSEKQILANADHYDQRKKLLDKFFRVILLQAFKKTPRDTGLDPMDSDTANSVRNVRLTRTEFAEALGMKPNALFVRNMFLLLDKHREGFVTFEEFINMFVTMSQGTSEEKARLIFNMYDINRDGSLSRREFDKMLRSMMDLADYEVESGKVEDLIQMMFDQAGISRKDSMTFDDFKKIFASNDHGDILQRAVLGLDVEGAGKVGKQNEAGFSRRKTFVNRYRESASGSTMGRQESKLVKAKRNKQPTTPFQKKWYAITRFMETYQLQIFWLVLYTLVVAGIFIERAYYYSVEREHAGLRRLAGYGVSVTRGAASAMMFTYACLVVTMSRNTLTFFRETFVHRFIPFDSFHAFHKYIAYLALMFTVMHCVGHGINLYHICTQASSDLNCYFREYFRATHILASFHYWAFTTVTGITGIILTLIVIIMYVFAQSYGRRNLFNAFWNTHVVGYILLYFFLFLHGAGRLVQDPLWAWFFLGPMVVFVLDKLVSISRNKVEIAVNKAELLPSGVTYLQFRRPASFDYKSGQWVRIASLGLGESEYHPFTLTSAPHEDHLSLHIRAVGPWTNNIRRIYNPNNLPAGERFPKLYLDGPFGEGHQDWYRYPVAVLVGGGIGVTPFASILKDIVGKASQGIKFPCRKVYFLWVTRNQKHFEWMTDIIRQVENADARNLVTVHIFITQFKEKFDLRTSMMYICERHFQKIAGQSLFTGLRAVTHFGRPPFYDFLSSLSMMHDKLDRVGVFSCGPPKMTASVNAACNRLQNEEGNPHFTHHFENF